MAKTEAFDRHLAEYEQWFEDHHYAFLSELEAIRELLPQKGRGVEIGVGSGLFASSLGIEEGCDPSEAMRKKAISRGINAIDCIAEKLPYADNSYDYAIMVTTICFVDNPSMTLKEINRILKPRGNLITGYVDKESIMGQRYLREKDKSLFYRDASFFSTAEIYNLLKENHFIPGKTVQTVFGPLEKITDIQYTENGYGKGSFIAVRATKKVEKQILFAMAVDRSGNFELKQFCHAWKFLLYEWKGNELMYIRDIDNPYRGEETKSVYEKEEKGRSIINVLKDNNVSVLVARNFGDNIEKAVFNFIPVIAYSETPAGVEMILTKHIGWLEDELQNKPSDYRLFTIKHGILKTSVHNKDGSHHEY